MVKDDIVEEKENIVTDSGMSHWDEHQPNIDELCDVSELEIIKPKKAIKMVLITFGLMLILDIMSFSSVVVDMYGNREVMATGSGLVLLVMVSGITSYYLGKTLKKPLIVVPAVIMISLIAIILSIYLGPILIPGSHFNFNTKFSLLLISSTIISTLSSYVGSGNLIFE